MIGAKRIDIDWFFTTTPNAGNSDADPLSTAYALAVAIAPNVPWANSYTWTGFAPLALATEDGEELDELADDPWGGGTIEFHNQGDGLESAIRRDPSGRLRRLTNVRDGSFRALHYRTSEIPSLANGFGWVDSNGSDAAPSISATDGTTTPNCIFHVFDDGKHKTEANGVDKNSNAIKVEAMEYPVLEILVYGDNKCQVHDYGKIMVANDRQELAKRDNDEQRRIIIGGYFDGPIPFPLQNYVGQTNLRANKHDIGHFVYGTSSEKEDEEGTETEWSFGVESEGKMTKGLGPAWKASYENANGSLDRTTTLSGVKGSLKVAAVATVEPGEEPTTESSGLINALTPALHHRLPVLEQTPRDLINAPCCGTKSDPKAILTRMARPAPLEYFSSCPRWAT